ncbi:MAG: ImmA/IrrE family metallo-endopeptidase [Candidatus Doudnabacteria bacterium]|nr:ImmA/IrrE family metallo-endopeptidase [Candidatus Doudnabacteria bacterium]
MITSAPVKINELLQHVPKAHNLTVKGTTALPNGLDAFTYKEEGLTIIGYNQSVAPVRQKFSVAHELGHLYMGHMHGQSSLDLNSTDFDEVEANQFAAHLIMPTVMLRKDIKAGIRDVKELATRYFVSEEAMWWQLSKTGLINQM